ncbi:MAG: Flp family type IVb pilin [Desulfuromonadales bacterium]
MARKSLLLNHEEGVTAIEYGLIIGLIALLIIAGSQIVGTTLNNKLIEFSTEIDNANG